MKKIYLILAVAMISLLWVSCSKDDDKTIDPSNNVDTNNTPDNAPIKIVGKALVLYNSKMQYTLQASGFTSNNTCSILMISSVFKLIGIPSYTYSKNTANDANLVVKYSDKLQIGSDYTNSNTTYTAYLSFSSNSGGTYTGTEKTVSTGNVAGLNGTTSRNISGTFTLY